MRHEPWDERPVEDLRLNLSRSRHVAVAAYGIRSGIAALYLHGCPGSRLEPMVFGLHEVARRSGVRLIAPDRPGIGRSSPDPARSVASYADDLVEILDRLEIASTAVVAYAEAGAYALAAAALMNERIHAVALVSSTTASPAPGGDDVTSRNLPTSGLLGPRGRVGWAASSLAARHAPHALTRYLTAHMPEIDAEVLMTASTRRLVARSLGEAFHQGLAGPELDRRVTSTPWSGDLSSVSGRVSLWQGVHDRRAAAPALALHDRIRRSHAYLLPEGRISLMARHGAAILADVARPTTGTGGPHDLHR